MEVPVLASLDYSLLFYIYSFASPHSAAAVLTQKVEGEERPIAFISSPFKKAKVQYSPLEKQAFALVWAVKKFWHYILRSKVHVIILDQAVKSLLMQSELGERWGKWMAILQEYDLEMQPMKIVQCRGLSRAMAEETPRIECQTYTVDSITQDTWHTDLVYLLLNNKCLEGLPSHKCHTLQMKSAHFMIKNSALYRRNYEGVYLWCIDRDQAIRIIGEFHG